MCDIEEDNLSYEDKLHRIRDEMIKLLVDNFCFKIEIANKIMDVLLQTIEHVIDPTTLIRTIIYAFLNDDLRILIKITNNLSEHFLIQFVLCCMKYFPNNWHFSDTIIVSSITSSYSKGDGSCRFYDSHGFKYCLTVSIMSDSKNNTYYSFEVRLKNAILETIEICDTKYKLCNKIGSGSYGMVYIAADTSGRKVAIKFGLSGDVLSDIEFCRICKGLGVIQVFGSYSFDPITAIVMPFYHRTLSTYMYENNTLSFEKRIQLIFQLLLIIQRLDRLGVVHCDIKSANVLVDETNPSDLKLILIDGGIFFQYEHGKERKEDQVCEEKVSRWYKSPRDVAAWLTRRRNVGKTTDWWPALVVGLEILNNGKVPHWLTLDSLKKMNDFFKSVLDGQVSMEALLLTYFETFYLESESSQLVKRMYNFFKCFFSVRKALSSSPYTIGDLVKEMTSILAECSIKGSHACALALGESRACAFGGSCTDSLGGSSAGSLGESCVCALGESCTDSLGGSSAGSLGESCVCALGGSCACVPKVQPEHLIKSGFL
jgi:hypothetical protein